MKPFNDVPTSNGGTSIKHVKHKRQIDQNVHSVIYRDPFRDFSYTLKLQRLDISCVAGHYLIPEGNAMFRVLSLAFHGYR